MGDNSNGSVPLTRMKDLDVDQALFEPMSTGRKVVDDLISNRGGIMPSTIIMVAGDAGAGKTTMLCDWLSGVHQNGYRVLFISSEMDHIDFSEYAARFPGFAEFDVYFVNYERDIKEDVSSLIDGGWDLILIDSFKDLKDKIADQEGSTKTAAEMFLVNELKRAKAGIETEHGTYHTATIFIQQILKSGDFAGSNALKHLVTASATLTVENEESYIMFNKNRRGDAHRRLYYEIDNDVLEYDVNRMDRQDDALDFMEKERERQKEQEQDGFASIEELVADGDDTSTQSDDRVEAVQRIMSEEGGNLSATLRRVKEEGLFSDDFSRYKLQQFVDNNGIQRQTYNT